MRASDSKKVFKILRKLAAHGWIPLGDMAHLLGYAHQTSIYQRQQGKSPIPTIKVGGTYRVYEDDVIETLKAHKNTDAADAELILSLYQGTKKNVESIRAS